VESFYRKHEATYGYSVKGEPLEVVNIAVTAVGVVKKPALNKHPRRKMLSAAKPKKREVYFEKIGDYVDTPIYAREKLWVSDVIAGPAVVEQFDCTTIINPGWSSSIDDLLNIIMLKENRS
jgi:N-methylhydantoinase A